jgi:hypothetical protein
VRSKIGKMQMCSRCKNTKYCSSECQKIDWRKNHKDTCIESKSTKHQHKKSRKCIITKKDIILRKRIEDNKIEEESEDELLKEMIEESKQSIISQKIVNANS